MCDLYDGFCIWRPHPVPALSAYLPCTLHWWLADAIIHMSLLHGASRCCSFVLLWNQLRWLQCPALVNASRLGLRGRLLGHALLFAHFWETPKNPMAKTLVPRFQGQDTTIVTWLAVLKIDWCHSWAFLSRLGGKGERGNDKAGDGLSLPPELNCSEKQDYAWNYFISLLIPHWESRYSSPRMLCEKAWVVTVLRSSSLKLMLVAKVFHLQI